MDSSQTFNYWPQIMFIANLVISGLVGFVAAWVKLSNCQVRIGTIETDTKEIKKQILEIIEKLAYMQGGLERDRAHPKYIESKSPLSLTDQGKAVLLDSHGKEYVDQNKQMLINEIKNKAPNSAYDIQEFSREIIELHSDDKSFVPIKDFAFLRGEKLKYIIDVLGIYLRDITLKELGFDISDIKD